MIAGSIHPDCEYTTMGEGTPVQEKAHVPVIHMRLYTTQHQRSEHFEYRHRRLGERQYMLGMYVSSYCHGGTALQSCATRPSSCLLYRDMKQLRNTQRLHLSVYSITASLSGRNHILYINSVIQGFRVLPASGCTSWLARTNCHRSHLLSRIEES